MAKLLGERKEEPKESSVKHPWAKIGPPTRNHSARPSTDSKLPLRLRSTARQRHRWYADGAFSAIAPTIAYGIFAFSNLCTSRYIV